MNAAFLSLALTLVVCASSPRQVVSATGDIGVVVGATPALIEDLYVRLVEEDGDDHLGFSEPVSALAIFIEADPLGARRSHHHRVVERDWGVATPASHDERTTRSSSTTSPHEPARSTLGEPGSGVTKRPHGSCLPNGSLCGQFMSVPTYPRTERLSVRFIRRY